MCAVGRVLMRLQDAQKKEPETEGFPCDEGGQGEGVGTEPTCTAQVLARQVPKLPSSVPHCVASPASVAVVEVYDFLLYWHLSFRIILSYAQNVYNFKITGCLVVVFLS